MVAVVLALAMQAVAAERHKTATVAQRLQVGRQVAVVTLELVGITKW